jgi:hypothetical protein
VFTGIHRECRGYVQRRAAAMRTAATSSDSRIHCSGGRVRRMGPIVWSGAAASARRFRLPAAVMSLWFVVSGCPEEYDCFSQSVQPRASALALGVTRMPPPEERARRSSYGSSP